MNYQEAVAWIYSTQTVGIKLGLENIERLLAALEIETPAPGGPVIFHVAGTNGKGSVCAMLDAALRAAGIRSGLFTSPHLVTFRERIRLDGAMIPQADVAAGLTRIRGIVGRWKNHPTFFEIATALALDWFRRGAARAIVLETGLGGRLDATNAVTPHVSVLTSLSLDHRQYLGDTLEEIAAEKAGILKPGIPAVSAPQTDAAARVITETARRAGAPLTWVREPVALEVALPGSHQKLNAALALEALKASPLAIPPRAVQEGLANVVWPGRFQIVERPGRAALVLDGAHNEAAAARLVQTWRERFGERRPAILLGILRDKDVAAICRELAPLAAEFIAAPVRSLRSCAVADLAGRIREAAPQTPCRESASAAEGLRLAEAGGRPVLATGSLFLVGEILALLDGGTAEASAQ